MKISKLILFMAAGTLMLSSCSDWLDVSPKTRVKEDDLFKSEAGFRDAIYGIYTVMARNSAYGGELAMAGMDVIAQSYSVVNGSYTYLSNFDYGNAGAKAKIDTMWATSYFAIANCNNLLDNIDAKRGVFSSGVYEITKAEAIALRAFLHFDMLRAFGPVPISENLDRKAIPIMLELSAVPSEFSTVRQVVDFVLSEVETARKLIAPFDPLGPDAGHYVEETQASAAPNNENYSDGGFVMYRRSRLNYYGMTALMARAALWAGRTQKAAEYAMEVIDSGQFSMMTEEDYNREAYINNWLSANEYVSSLYTSKLKTDIEEKYFLRDEGVNAGWVSAALYLNEDGLSSLFGSDRDFDWRYKKLIGQNAHGDYVPLKYAYGYRIPIIKIAEMHYIVAEAQRSVAKLNEVRDHRGFENNRLDPALTDFQDALTMEYRREFFAEGQLFFYYKRNNFSAFPNGAEASAKVYVLPLPDNEIEFGFGGDIEIDDDDDNDNP